MLKLDWHRKSQRNHLGLKPQPTAQMSEAGFTLIEIILVVTISAALGAMVLSGQRQVRQRAQFSDGVEKIKNSLVGVKNEANTTVNSAGGNDTDRIVIGKLARFTDNSSQIEVGTLVARCTNPTCSEINPTLNQQDTYTITVPWGVTFDDPPSTVNVIAFIRSPLDGELTVYTPQKSDNVLDAGIYRRDSTTARQRATLRFDDPNGYGASIFVNAARLPGGGFDAGEGLITRSFD
jgi:prepilin-type N-terminal cleavage/methylation domain-containing protein